VSAFGSDCDARVLSKSIFGKVLYNRTLNILYGTRKLPRSNIELPYFVIGQRSFPIA